MSIDAHEVAPKLYVGSVPMSSLRWHFDTVVLCAEENQDIDTDIETIRAPLDDGRVTPQLRRTALWAARKVVKHLKAGKRVLVTCTAGINRSSLVAALALMQLGTPAGLAISTIRQRRRPPGGFTPLSNYHFEAWLRTLGEKVQG